MKNLNLKRFFVFLGSFVFVTFFLIRQDVIQRPDKADQPITPVVFDESLEPKKVSTLNVLPQVIQLKDLEPQPDGKGKSETVAVSKKDKTKPKSSISVKEVTAKEELQNAVFRLGALRMNILEETLGMKHSQILEAYLKNGSSLPPPKMKLSKAKQIIVATTWRSGSTFLNELIGSHPGTYNFYEPLLPYGNFEFYDEKNLTRTDGLNVQELIHDLLKCKYSSTYVPYLLKRKELLIRNSKLWSFCKGEGFSGTPLCTHKSFLEKSCSAFPWIVMKVVRLGLKFYKPILEDESLNPYVIYLVRDPRAVINSRIKTVSWCKGACKDPVSLCNQMEDNLKHYRDFSTLYPGRIHLLRYEDISISPMDVSKEILQNIDLDFNPKTEEFLNSHTKLDVEKPWSTKRESSKHVLKWTSQIDSVTLNRVQKACTKVMEQMGYLQITSTKNITINDVLGPLNL